MPAGLTGLAAPGSGGAAPIVRTLVSAGPIRAASFCAGWRWRSEERATRLRA